MKNSKDLGDARPTRNTIGNPRPPSRHKTPPKATGLDLPPSLGGDFITIDQMYDFPFSSDSGEISPYSNTQTFTSEKSKPNLKES